MKNQSIKFIDITLRKPTSASIPWTTPNSSMNNGSKEPIFKSESPSFNSCMYHFMTLAKQTVSPAWHRSKFVAKIRPMTFFFIYAPHNISYKKLTFKKVYSSYNTWINMILSWLSAQSSDYVFTYGIARSS